MTDTLIARLRGHANVVGGGDEDLLREAADALERAALDYNAGLADGERGVKARLERAERVVEDVRAILRDEQNDEQSDLSYDHLSSQRYNALNRIRSAFSAYDRLNDVTVAQVTDATRATRPCPNSVSFCGGPDRYGDICAACLATWTADHKALSGDNK